MIEGMKKMANVHRAKRNDEDRQRQTDKHKNRETHAGRSYVDGKHWMWCMRCAKSLNKLHCFDFQSTKGLAKQTQWTTTKKLFDVFLSLRPSLRVPLAFMGWYWRGQVLCLWHRDFYFSLFYPINTANQSSLDTRSHYKIWDTRKRMWLPGSE